MKAGGGGGVGGWRLLGKEGLKGGKVGDLGFWEGEGEK